MEEIKTPEGGTVIQIPIEDEVKKAYIDYSMSVIVQRALPDVRDGLKPVHRRIMYAMDKLNLTSGGKTKKCAQIVGEVLGHYHPHGDMSVYDALVRLGQDFAQRYTTVTPQGNFGTIAGDPAAAYRYTEAKMSKITEEMVADISKNTVDMAPNFDDTTVEPAVLPASFPFLLCNGTTGIAVGMATNMPSHNLREVAAAIGAYIDNPEISIDELCKYIKGPDFPTGGVIYGRDFDNDFYIAANTDTHDMNIILPTPEGGKVWARVVDTSFPAGEEVAEAGQEEVLRVQNRYVIPANSFVMLMAVRK